VAGPEKYWKRKNSWKYGTRKCWVSQRCRNTCISEESFAGIFNRTQVDDIKLRSVSYGQEMMKPKIPCELWARNLTLAVYIHSCKLRQRSYLHAMTLCSFLHARTQSYTCTYLGPKSRFSLVILSSCAEIISLVKVYIYAQWRSTSDNLQCAATKNRSCQFQELDTHFILVAEGSHSNFSWRWQ